MKLADLFVKLGLKNSEFNRGLKDSEKKTNAFGNGLKKIGGLIAGAFAVGQIVSFGKELLELGGVAEGVRAAFNRIADDRVLDDLKKATSGTVSELELMKRAVSAQNLGLPVENLAKLFEFATKRAQDTGESVDYLVNSIVTGIGRKSPLILDNLGISAIQLREKLKGVGMETASVADVAKAVGEIAADSMRESGGVIDTNAIKVQNLKAQWDDFKTSIAESPEINNAFGLALDYVNRQLRMLPDNLNQSKKALRFVFGSWIKDAKILVDEFGRTDEEIRKANETLKSFSQILWSIGGNFSRMSASQKVVIDDTKEQIDFTQLLNERLWELNKLASQFKPIDLTPATLDTEDFQKSLSFGLTPEDSVPDLFDTEQRVKDLENLAAFVEDAKMLVADFGTEVVEEFGNAIGQLIATGEFPASFGKSILAVLGKFISTLGKMMIALGIASKWFQDLLKSAFANPAAAIGVIAAGATLVAIGGAIGGYASSFGGGGSSVSSSANTASFNVITTDQRDRQLVAKVTGNQLAFVLGKYNSDLSKI